MRLAGFLTSLAALLSGAGCAALGVRPEIQDIRGRVTSIDAQGVSLTFDVDVKNPYPVPLKTPNFKYGLDIDQEPFVESGSAVNVDLPAGTTGTASLPVQIRYADLWALASSLRQSKEFSYRLHGAFLVTALGESFELPLQHQGTCPVLRLPRLSVKDVNVRDVSLSSARVDLDVEVTNPNVFSIDSNQLGYAVRMGDVQLGSVTASTLGEVAAGSTGRVTITGELKAKRALLQLARGASVGNVELRPTGSLGTPYGAVELDDSP